MDNSYLELWKEVLQQAIDDAAGDGYAHHASEESMNRAQALAWIASNSEEPQSFVWVCEQLDIDPGFARKQIMERLRQDKTPQVFEGLRGAIIGLRRRMNLSQMQLGRMVGVPASSISCIETGKRQTIMRTDKLFSLLEAHGYGNISADCR